MTDLEKASFYLFEQDIWNEEVDGKLYVTLNWDFGDVALHPDEIEYLSEAYDTCKQML